MTAKIERANRLNTIAAVKEAGVHPERRGVVLELLGKRESPRDDLGSYDDEALTGAVGEIVEEMPFVKSAPSVTPLRFTGEPPGRAPGGGV